MEGERTSEISEMGGFSVVDSFGRTKEEEEQGLLETKQGRVIQAMQQQFERMFKVMGDVRDHLEKHDESITRLQGELRRGRQPAFVNDVYDGGEDTDDGQATIIGQDVNPRRQTRRGRFDGVD
ncbi:hypothetical protein LWI29_024771 [Acer saccharum]|uniref:Uncharacterized protein n=1 Tax=Acer saccharum TaxID=4024 RepID=A0AA39RZM3_ACESA|nr:hypothetical protein LWI29_024771 [Acer saccharum]